MNLRKIAVTLFGVTQEVMGVLAVVFAYVLYYNILNVRADLGIFSGHVPIYLILLFVFGSVSILSGLFLLHQRLELEEEAFLE